jgi:alkylation response protein AidB-like acyl-CoA dehydrogenase
VDLTWTPEEQAFREEARAWLAAHVPAEPLPSGDTRAGFARHLEWERRLFDARWAVVSWPEAYGGRDASLWEWLIFEEEYYRAGAPQRVTQNGIFLLAPTLFEFGTPEQQDRFLPRMASGEETWCQGWSEPDAGSDLAGITSKARRDEAAGGWRLDGQKTWTTRGAFCTHLFGLFRTDPTAERHRGLTYFLVPLDTPGVTVRGFGRLDGDEGFAEVFLDDVLVPDDLVLGAVDQGWSVAMATTGSERGLTLRSPGRFLATAQRLVELARERGADASDPGLRQAVAQAVIDAEAYQLQTLGTVTRLAAGERPGAESSLTKVFWSELDVRLHETALGLLGYESELEGPWMKGYEFALSGPIYAGTNEIQRNVIAERVRDLLEKECPPAAVRDAWTNDSGRTKGAWAALGEMGVLGALVPESGGGLGLTELDVVLLAEEAGRAALPEPFVEHVLVGAPLVGGEAVASGEHSVSAGDPLVPYAATADLVVVLAPEPMLVAAEHARLEPCESVDGSRRVAWVTTDHAERTLSRPELSRAFWRGTLGYSAQLIGLGHHLLDTTVEYVQQRHQFGVPIGSFQALKHKLADVRIALEFAAPLVHRAAYSLAHDDPDLALHGSMAKAQAAEAALLAARHALQCHGAIGYSFEHDLHLWMKRVWALAVTWGDAAWHRERVAVAVLDGGSGG